ncbi:hypothetical protein [Haliangium sp.]|uniref:hypothetical protein n=1 Tax=Haliangium sp. TaxID=2663208 RepID=UPI003D0B7A73
MDAPIDEHALVAEIRRRFGEDDAVAFQRPALLYVWAHAGVFDETFVYGSVRTRHGRVRGEVARHRS